MSAVSHDMIAGPLLARSGGYTGIALGIRLPGPEGHQLIIVGKTPEATVETFRRLWGDLPDMAISKRVVVLDQEETYALPIAAAAINGARYPALAEGPGYPLATWWREVGQYQLLRESPAAQEEPVFEDGEAQ